MVVVYEFFSNEAIENVITCMHFKVDKVVFFEYYDVRRDKKENVKRFLERYCGVQTVVFQPLPANDLQAVLKAMENEIRYELDQGARFYFDITGGESLILVAFGMLAREYKAPMHIYDIEKDRLIELDSGFDAAVSRELETQEVKLNLESFIGLQGGVINWRQHKGIKGGGDPEFLEDVTKIWRIAGKYTDYWNLFTDFLRKNMVPDQDLSVDKPASQVLNALLTSHTKLHTPAMLNSILDELADEGILLDVNHRYGNYHFRFKNQSIKECIWEGGSILELYTFKLEMETSQDCGVGIHLDWDGVIQDRRGIDVLNEIDVLSIRGNIPTFISCKSGNMSTQQVLHALYELETVASRFGGKYARKVLVTARELGDVYLERAVEMGVEVRPLFLSEESS